MDSQTKQGHNADHQTEKKKLREAEEKKMGVLVYLGQSVADAKGELPAPTSQPQSLNTCL